VRCPQVEASVVSARPIAIWAAKRTYTGDSSVEPRRGIGAAHEYLESAAVE
jgi:hypothetical protein